MRQKTLGIREIYNRGAKRLNAAGVRDFQTDAWYLLEYVTGIDKASYLAEPDRTLTKEQTERYDACIEKRCRRIPLQHITGEQVFMGLPFLVNEHVLVPRQDTEILAEEALGALKAGDRILDMCTGSGCILLSLLKLTKADNVTGVGADISEKALETARRNAENLGVYAEFVQGDLFEHISPEQKFDLIVSNPPYIRTAVIEELEEEVRCHDPRIALDGKEDGLYFYRRIIEESALYMTRGAWLMFEIGFDQGAEVTGLMEKAGYRNIRIKKDFAALDRVAIGMYNGE